MEMVDCDYIENLAWNWHREPFIEANPSNNTPYLYASFTVNGVFGQLREQFW